MWCWLIPFLGCLLSALLGYLLSRAMTPTSKHLAKVTVDEVSFIPPEVVKEHGSFQGLQEEHDELRSSFASLEREKEDWDSQVNALQALEHENTVLKQSLAESTAQLPVDAKHLSEAEIELIPDSKIIRHSAYQTLYRQFSHLQEKQEVTDIRSREKALISAEDVRTHHLYQDLSTAYEKLKQSTKSDDEHTSDQAQIDTLNARIENLNAENIQQQANVSSLKAQLEQAEQEKHSVIKKAAISHLSDRKKLSSEPSQPSFTEADVKAHVLYQRLESDLEQAQKTHDRLERSRVVLSEQQQALNHAVTSLKEENQALRQRLEAPDDGTDASMDELQTDVTALSEKVVQRIPDTKIKLHKAYQTLSGQHNGLLRELAQLKQSDGSVTSLKMDKHNLLIENEELESRLSLAQSRDEDSVEQINVRSLPEAEIKTHSAYQQLSTELQDLQRENLLLRQNQSDEPAQDDSDAHQTLMKLRVENMRLNEELSEVKTQASKLDISQLKEADILAIPEKAITKHRAYRVLIAQHRELKHAYDSLSRERSSFVANQIAEKTTLHFDAELATKVFGKAIKADDLTVIEGIGPKIAGLLAAENINTWYTLSQTRPERCQEILTNAGPRYRHHDASTWPRQAKMAFEGKWQALFAWQERLDGGKEV